MEKRFFVEPHIPTWADFDMYLGKTVLEIGSGIGSDSIKFALSGASVFAGDLSEASINVARLNSQALETKNIKFFVHNFENQNLPINLPQKPDLIYSFGVIHHSPNPQKIFSNLSHWAKPETQIKIMVYSKYSTKALGLYLKFGLFKGLKFDEAVALQSEAQSNSPFTYTYSKKSIKFALSEAGLSVKRIKKAHIFPYKIDEYKKGMYRKKLIWLILGDRARMLLGRLLGWHLLVEAKLAT